MATAVPTSDWAQALDRVLTDPRRIRVVYQPIVDLDRRDVCGYEALARFPDAPGISPLAWFQAAAALGCAGAFEAEVISAALVAWPLLGAGRFVTVNVTPQALTTPEVQRALAAEPRFDRLVVELGAADGHDPGDLHAAAAELSRAGIAIAVSGAAENLGLLPRFVKAPVDELDAIVAPRGSQMIAEQVETSAQLVRLRRRGPHLAQGYGLAHPGRAPGVDDAAIRRRLAAFARG